MTRGNVRPFRIVKRARCRLISTSLPVVALLGIGLGLLACSDYLAPTERLRLMALPEQPDPSRYFQAERIAQLQLPGVPRSLTMNGSILYAFLLDQGIAVIDTSDPADMEMVYHVPSRPGYLQKGVNHYYYQGLVDGDRMLVVNRHHGLSCFDLTDPGRPTYRWTKSLPSNQIVHINHVKDSYYISAGGQGLYRLPHDFDLSTQAERVFYHADYVKQSALYPPHWLLLADNFSNGLQVLDITDTTQPHLVHTFNTGNFCDALAVFDDFVITANRNLGALVLDMTQPGNPFVASIISPGRRGYTTTVHRMNRHYCLVGSAAGFFDVLGLEDPHHPQFLSRLPAGAHVNCFASREPYVYIGLQRSPNPSAIRPGHQLTVFRLVTESPG